MLEDIEIDWMLPGVTPTGKYVEVPLIAIVNFHGDKLLPRAHLLGSGEYWDRASVLTQIGLLDAKSLPAARIETPEKLVDETLPSTRLMKHWEESAPKRATGAPRMPADE